MKKLTITLLMLLCMAMSMLALASCNNSNGGDCDHEWAEEATVDAAPTCDTVGSKSVKCTKCNEKKNGSTETIPAAHNWAAEATADKESTCSVAGSKSIKCTVCGEKKAGTTEPAELAAHSWAAVSTIDREPTCSVAGSKSVKCTVCSAKNPDTVQSINTIAHDWADVATVDTPATCTQSGVKTVKCKECPAKKPGSEEYINAEHTWGVTHTVDTPASCTTDGSKSIKCTVAGCGAKKPGSEVAIPATHSVKSGTISIYPTLFVPGERVGTCDTCGKTNVAGIINVTSPTLKVIDSSYSGTVVQKWNIYNSILKDGSKCFYPTANDEDGMSLFVEFTFLWNETLANNIYTPFIEFGRLSNSGGDEGNAMWKFAFADDIEDFSCPIAGGFVNGTPGTIIDGPDCVTEFPNIGEYGWHRIGVEIRQSVEVVNGKGGEASRLRKAEIPEHGESPLKKGEEVRSGGFAPRCFKPRPRCSLAYCGVCLTAIGREV